ncbi:MAG TPA: hypothetical protein VN285_07750 [Candidatus Deferrimicrobium sp.]|nr:hypothetical protein [Candidatus Deferrimicrobium sp.]
MSRRINLLCTNIGRGHPFYLDGILEALTRRGQVGLVREHTDVLAVSCDVSRWAWQTVRWLYRNGSSPGLLSMVYNRLRASADYNRPSLFLKVMGRDVRRRFREDPDPLVVAHPTLVAIMRGKSDLIYQHGEVVVPREAAVAGASKVLVPTADAAEASIRAGYRSNDVIVTGLCIEPSLVKQAADHFAGRLDRLAGRGCLVGAFFTSGAEPLQHVQKLTRAAVSAVAGGGKAIVFAEHNGRLTRSTMQAFEKRHFPVTSLSSEDLIPSELPEILLLQYCSRREEYGFAARLFRQFDYFVSPAHERTNWALGLGIPMFIVGPSIGPFAPLNREVLLSAGVAQPLDSVSATDGFGGLLEELRITGALQSMARNGWGRLSVRGFDRIAEFLITTYGN